MNIEYEQDFLDISIFILVNKFDWLINYDIGGSIAKLFDFEMSSGLYIYYSASLSLTLILMGGGGGAFTPFSQNLGKKVPMFAQ